MIEISMSRHKRFTNHLANCFYKQFSVFIISGATAAFSFSLVDLQGFPSNSVSSMIFYGIWMCGLYISFPGVYACMAPATMNVFGKEHYFSIYGMLFTQSVSSVTVKWGKTLFLGLILDYGTFIIDYGSRSFVLFSGRSEWTFDFHDPGAVWIHWL